jgi:3'-5' exonuclease
MHYLKQILFIDIETVSLTPDYNALPTELQQHWDHKAKYLKGNAHPDASSAELFTDKAGIFSEFAKVVCIGIGRLVEKEDGWKLGLKSITGHDEKVLLNSFCDSYNKLVERFPELKFCGHNIKEFDIPFLCRRMMINGVPLPESMQLSGKRPWEIQHLDTLELWRFGDYKHFTSLALLAAIFDIPSPKDDINGSEVGQVYWQQGDLDRIATYCLKDVLTTAKVFLRLKGITDMNIEPLYVTD